MQQLLTYAFSAHNSLLDSYIELDSSILLNNLVIFSKFRFFAISKSVLIDCCRIILTKEIRL